MQVQVAGGRWQVAGGRWQVQLQMQVAGAVADAGDDVGACAVEIQWVRFDQRMTPSSYNENDDNSMS